jgi:hypothetical protein
MVKYINIEMRIVEVRTIRARKRFCMRLNSDIFLKPNFSVTFRSVEGRNRGIDRYCGACCKSYTAVLKPVSYCMSEFPRPNVTMQWTPSR